MTSLKVKSLFITGANRGIGLEFVRQLISSMPPPEHVFATYRDKSTSADLHRLAAENSTIHPIQLDVSDFQAYPGIVKQVEEVVGESGLNVLINNAGIIERNPLEQVTPEEMMKLYKVNALAPMFLSREFLPLLKMAAKRRGEGDQGEKLSVSRAAIINISTRVSSIDDNGSGGKYGYRASKIALNMINKNLSLELKGDGILCVLLHPSWVRTDMGGPRGFTTPEDSVSGLLSVMSTFTEENTGLFYDFLGKAIPW